MLVEFKFSNFRSFKEEVIFSMEPLTQNGTNPNTINTGLKKIPQLYRTAGIFGANASGKSNVLDAFVFLKYLLRKSPKMNVEDIWPDERYALSGDNLTKPMSFGIQIIIKDILYDYKVQLHNNLIQKESLYYTPISQEGSAMPNRIFNRIMNDGKAEFEKSKGILQRWCDDTLNNRLFLSALVNSYNCQIKEIVDVYNELVNNIIAKDAHSISKNFSINRIAEGQGKKIIHLLKQADLGIEDVSVKEISLDELLKDSNVKNKEIATKIVQAMTDKGDKIFDIKSYHITESGSAKEFDFNHMESDGTKAFLALSGPLLQAIEDGKVIFIDELDSALHPYLVRYLVSLFNDSDINKNNAQLVFTSHSHYLMDGDHLSRDQIWFTSKELNNGFYSDLYSLSDFKKITRRNSSFYEAYMNGIYGAVPFVEKING